MVKNRWIRIFGQNCDNIWELDDVARDAADRKYVSASNWRQREYNRCARMGVSDMVTQYERLCLDDTSDQCFDLAQAAAEAIAIDFGCKSIRDDNDRPTSYQSACRQVAINSCPGSLTTTLNDGCPSEIVVTTTKRLELQAKCASNVNRLLDI